MVLLCTEAGTELTGVVDTLPVGLDMCPPVAVVDNFLGVVGTPHLLVAGILLPGNSEWFWEIMVVAAVVRWIESAVVVVFSGFGTPDQCGPLFHNSNKLLSPLGSIYVWGPYGQNFVVFPPWVLKFP